MNFFSSPLFTSPPTRLQFYFPIILIFTQLYIIFRPRRPLRLPLKWIKIAANQFSAVKCDTVYAFARLSAKNPPSFLTFMAFCVDGISGSFCYFICVSLKLLDNDNSNLMEDFKGWTRVGLRNLSCRRCWKKKSREKQLRWIFHKEFQRKGAIARRPIYENTRLGFEFQGWIIFRHHL